MKGLRPQSAAAAVTLMSSAASVSGEEDSKRVVYLTYQLCAGHVRAMLRAFSCSLSRAGSRARMRGSVHLAVFRLPAQRDCLLWPTFITYTCIRRQSLIGDLCEIFGECALPHSSVCVGRRQLTCSPSCNGVSRGLYGVVCFFLIGPPCVSQWG